MTSPELALRLSHIQERIAIAAERTGRSSKDVTLLAVTKMHSTKDIQAAYDLGLRDLGESRVQELTEKHAALPADIRWHFIGPLQSNKVKYLAPFVHLLHSVHSRSALDELRKQAEKAGRVIDILIEVNISGEAQKVGLSEQDASEFASLLPGESILRVRGLMGMASFEEDPERTREQFRRLKLLHTTLASQHPEWNEFDQLSMGMSNDFEVAIEEGSTIVRIGSALFGER